MSGEPLRATTTRSGCRWSRTATAYVPVIGGGAGDQVGDDLGVGLGGECHPLGRQTLAHGCRVVDDPVVDDADSTVLTGVRVGVVLRGRAVGGPARMSDTRFAGKTLGQRRLQVTDAADLAEDLGTLGCLDRDPRRVVPAVLQT
jgi:hypothetical protein